MSDAMSVIQMGGRMYEGESCDGLPHGFGTIVNTDGSYHTGYWCHGMPHGYGMYGTSKTDVNYGCFINGELIDENELIFINSDKYTPRLSSDSSVEGTVIKVDSNGNYYCGQWKNCKRNGFGKLTYGNGKPSKTGFFYNGKYIGKITSVESDTDSCKIITLDQASVKPIRWELVDGTTYIGEWENGTFNGYGTLTEGTLKQEGYFLRGEYIGKVIDQNGQRINRNYEGQVTVNYKNGDIFSGSWNKNGRTGTGSLRQVNGDFYKGSWSRNKKNGKGLLKYSDGFYYEGNFKDDLPDGDGVYNYGKSKYEGHVTGGIRNGVGTYTYEDGKHCSGVWLNGLMNDLFCVYGSDNILEFEGVFYKDLFLKDGIFHFDSSCSFNCISSGFLFYPDKIVTKRFFLGALDKFIKYLASGLLGRFNESDINIFRDFRHEIFINNFSVIDFNQDRCNLILDHSYELKITMDLKNRIDDFLSKCFSIIERKISKIVKDPYVDFDASKLYISPNANINNIENPIKNKQDELSTNLVKRKKDINKKPKTSKNEDKKSKPESVVSKPVVNRSFISPDVTYERVEDNHGPVKFMGMTAAEWTAYNNEMWNH